MQYVMFAVSVPNVSETVVKLVSHGCQLMLVSSPFYVWFTSYRNIEESQVNLRIV